MFVLLLSLLSIPFLFYKLGQSSLTSWDEAWYASIAKNIIKTGELFTLHFNGKTFFDHPPFGFWMIALGQSLFGANEFGSRVMSAIFGIIAVVFTYLIGKNMFGRLTGFFAGAALLSSPWFLSRARSGNLDIFLTALFVASVYFALLIKNNKKYLIHLSFSLAFLFLTKTMIPFAVIPVIILIALDWKKIKLKDLVLPIFITVLPIVFWVYVNYRISPDLFIKNYFKIGLTGVQVDTNYLESFKLIKTYAHNGIGTWFRSSVLALVAGLVIFRNKKFLILSVSIGSVLAPFLFSDKGHIWHMIPIYPFMLLSLFGFVSVFFEKYFTHRIIKLIIITFIFLLLFIPQMKRNWREFVEVPAFITDEAILGREAGKYTEDLILDDDFVPTIVFYSDKKVERTVVPLKEYFGSDRKFVMIVRDFRLGASGVDSSLYEILKKDRDKLLVIKR